jgi:hypothetical protein
MSDGYDTYIGIADQQGVESLHRESDLDATDKMHRVIRVNANRHRQAVYFEAEISNDTIDLIHKQLRDSKYKTALHTIKELALEIRVPQEQCTDFRQLPA